MSNRPTLASTNERIDRLAALMEAFLQQAQAPAPAPAKAAKAKVATLTVAIPVTAQPKAPEARSFRMFGAEGTQNVSIYGTKAFKRQAGTAHVSSVKPDGESLALTLEGGKGKTARYGFRNDSRTVQAFVKLDRTAGMPEVVYLTVS
jgi:hypothetical protein